MTVTPPIEVLRRRTAVTIAGSAVTAAMLPVVLILSHGATGPADVVLILGSVAFMPLHWYCLRSGLRSPATPVTRRVTVPLLALSVLLALLGSAQSAVGWLWFVVIGFAVADLSIGRPIGVVRVFVVVAGCLAGMSAVLVAWQQAPADAGRLALVGGLVLFLVGGMVYSEPSSLSSWRSMMELDTARRHSTEIGAQRERLRLSEDLHDMLGHTLEVVALKAELATRLGSADPERARTEMAEVQRLARDSLQEVRELVRERQETDLVVELRSVVALLDAAGITCDVQGDPADFDQLTRRLFGRVLRESTTNLLRHAEPARCRIELVTNRRDSSLTVVNDGTVDHSDGRPEGTGLAGLARRLAEHGGTVSAGPGPGPGTFQVAASLPAASLRGAR
ncbi:two-component system sensor histidine kinase DesK [Actinoalloteichus hoggarensis]|uniref:Sensor histidine kinase DesK n=1 Tax=Actinoalloteichus hoggarensis TaxID=1470176 RepID=A0A221VXE2_9PSEU|nr:histidine kinase [Actinoalloteichus hoggarensis]ASO18220.1 Sensor histidine kinase DesK [Actinoalloteichus hoggarensis]MBB5921577.1 two-component system sensor histidine kinase DesK [Actinoalloteichus hoggarensis]